jgi:hypothetical protein
VNADADAESVQVRTVWDMREQQLALGALLKRAMKFLVTAFAEHDDIRVALVKQTIVVPMMDVKRAAMPRAEGTLMIAAFSGCLGDLLPVGCFEIFRIGHGAFTPFAQHVSPAV